MEGYKVVVLGSEGVGKSALTARFIEGAFVDNYNPTVEESYRKTVEIDDRHCRLEILDTAGFGQLVAMRDHYMKNGQGFVLVYSITSQSSFSELHELVEWIHHIKDSDAVPLIIVGNKCDLEDERFVTSDQGINFAKQFHYCSFLESSAKASINVDEIFLNLIRQIHEQPCKKRKKQKKICNIL